MKKKKFLFSLLMAIVMMAMSPTRVWAQTSVTLDKSKLQAALRISEKYTLTFANSAPAGATKGDALNSDNTIYLYKVGTTYTVAPTTSGAVIMAPEDCSYMFNGCTMLTSLTFTNFNTSNVTNMSYMFSNCPYLASLDVTGFNTSNVTNMSGMFADCEVLASLNVTGFNTSNVTNMSEMFANCKVLPSLDVTGFNTEKVTDMSSMFSNCPYLASLDVEGFNTANVKNMQCMFNKCSVLTSLELRNFNTAKVTDMTSMFDGCSNLSSIVVTNDFTTASVTYSNSQYMFSGCTKLTGGKGTTYNSSQTDKDYARIDGGPTSSTPGYFTKACEHSLVEHPAVAATLVSDGNSAYWSCSTCGKYFGDAEGKTKIAENSWVIAKTTNISLGTRYIDGKLYYEIGSAEDMLAFRTLTTKGSSDGQWHMDLNAILTADIVYDGTTKVDPIGFIPGLYSDYSKAYSGIFDGDNHTIKNLRINTLASNTNMHAFTLFGGLKGATIKNLYLEDVDYTFRAGYSASGVLAETAESSTLSNIYIKGTFKTDSYCWGACFVGYSRGSNTFTNCGVNAEIDMSSGNSQLASGMVYEIENGTTTFTNCYFNGSFTGITTSNASTRKTAPFYYGLYGTGVAKINNCYAVTYQTSYDGTDAKYKDYTVKNATITYKAPSAFTSGEVAYLLNGSQDAGTWRQKLSGEGVNTTPVLKQTDDNKVYYGYADCVATEKTYANSALHATQGHSFTNYTYNNDATCVKNGTKTASCDNGCGTTDTKDDPEHPATGIHTLTHHPAKEATYTQNGNRDYWSCSVCNALFADAAGNTPTTEFKIAIPTIKRAFTHVEQYDEEIVYLGTAAFDIKEDMPATLTFDDDGNAVMIIGDNTVAKVNDNGALVVDFTTTLDEKELNKVSKEVSYVGYATLYSPFQLAVPAESDVKVYAPTYDESEQVLSLKNDNKVNGRIIPAGTGVMLKNEGSIDFTITSAAPTYTNVSALSGSAVKIDNPTKNYEVNGKTVYTLGKYEREIGFYRYKGNDLNPGLAYLYINTLKDENDAKGISLVFDDDMTSIKQISPLGESEGAVKYLQNGSIVIIKNGKKYNTNGQLIK